MLVNPGLEGRVHHSYIHGCIHFTSTCRGRLRRRVDSDKLYYTAIAILFQ